MQNEHNNPQSPSSRSPVGQVQEIENQEDPELTQNVLRSSLLRSSSDLWTPTAQSFSSYSSQEYDALSHIQTHDTQPPPSLTSPFHHATRSVSTSQQATHQHPTPPRSYQPQFYPEEHPNLPHLTQTPSAQFPDPYSGTAYASELVDFQESHGPPLPYPYIVQQQARRESSQPRRLSLVEGPTHGRRTQGTRSARTSRAPSPAEHYHGRRASHDLRSQSQPTYSPPVQPYPQTRPTARPPFRPSLSYPSTSIRTLEYGSYPQSQPSLSPALPARGPTPMGPPYSTPGSAIPSFPHQPPPVGRPMQPLSHSYPSAPYGSRPLPNVSERTDIPSSRQSDYSSPAPTRLPPVQDIVSPPIRRRSRHIGRASISPTAHQLRTPAERRQIYPQLGEQMQKRRKPPDPFTSYAIMLADIIRDSPRKKMTLQELYDYLKVRYPEHFPDDGFDDKAEGKAGYGGGWRNTVRHALSVNKWFKKQYRTDADAKLDEIDPNRPEPAPIDNEDESVAPPTDRSRMTGPLPGGHRPLKGGYWFIRDMYKAEVDAAIAKDKEKLLRPPRGELEYPMAPGPSRSMMMEDPMRDPTMAMVGQRQPQGPPTLQVLPLPPGPPLEALDPDQSRPTFPPPLPSRTWPYPPT